MNEDNSTEKTNPKIDSDNIEIDSVRENQVSANTKEKVETDAEGKKSKERSEEKLRWSIFTVSEHPVTEVVESFCKYPENQFEKTGFYLAIDPKAVPIEKAKERLSELIKDQDAEVEKAIGEVEQHILSQKTEIITALTKLDQQVNQEATRLNEAMERTEILETEKLDLQRDIEKIKGEIQDILERIGTQSAELIEKRILALKQELKELVTTFEEISAIKKEINKAEFLESKDVLEVRAERYQRFYDAANDRLKIVQEKLQKVPGLTDHSHQFLFWAGVGASGGAGWFFSVYIVNKSLFSSDFLSYFFTRLFSIGGGIVGESGLSLILIMIAGLLGILIITTLFSWLGQKFLLKSLGLAKEKKKRKRKNKSDNLLQNDGSGLETDISLSFGEEEKNFYRTRITAGSFFSFWLQALPVIFLMGIVFILLSVSGTGTEEVGKLMSSLSGHFVGTSIAFGLAGLIYVYIRTVIDRRAEISNEDEEEGDTFLKRNWELASVVVAFLLAMIGLVIWPDQAFVAIFGFIAISLMTGFVIGYAVYYKGLVKSENELKNEMIHISFAMDNCRRPRPLYIMGAEGEQFKYNYLLLMEQMYKLSQLRNEQAAEALVGKEFSQIIPLHEVKPKRKNKGFKFGKMINRFLGSSDKEKIKKGNGIMGLSGPDKRYYPTESLAFRSLKLELKNKLKKLTIVETTLENTRSEKTTIQVTALERIKKLEGDRTSLIEAKDRLGRLRLSAINSLTIEKEKRIIALRDGFDLGLWHRANDVEPTPKYNFKQDTTTTNE